MAQDKTPNRPVIETEPFKPAVSFTPEETEQFRIERLTEAAADRDTSAEDLAADFAPETFGCHEALQMASFFMDTVDRHLCEHPSVLANPDWFRLASDAQTSLYNLYQAIGELHLRPVLEDAAAEREKNDGIQGEK